MARAVEPTIGLMIPISLMDTLKKDNIQTGEDLFFSNTPKYTTYQICFFQTKDKLRKDTIRPQVIGSGVSRYFSMRLTHPIQKDTLIIKVPSNNSYE